MRRTLHPKIGAGRYSRKILLSRLNGPTFSGLSSNMQRVFEAIRELNDECLKRPSASQALGKTEDCGESQICIDGRTHILFGQSKQYDRLLFELNHRTKQYTNLPVFCLRKGRLSLSWASTVPQGRPVTDAAWFPMIVDAMVAGDLQKLARCSYCHRWYLRRLMKVPHTQQFCSAPARCRQSAFEATVSKTAEFRKQRAEYMQKRRKEEKAREKRERKLAGIKEFKHLRKKR